MPTVKPAPTIDDIRAAARRLRGVATVTPLLPDRILTERLGRPVFVKPECLQVTGSFKFRGAYNRIAAMNGDERGRGVVAFSSGNHAQGVAAAARMFGISAAIVMPADAPAAKIEGTRSWGAEIVLFDRETGNREQIAADLAEQRGATLIPSFDDPYIIAGQATAGLEIATAVAARGVRLDAVVTPVGGGGLASGLGLALRAAVPGAALFGVEPHGFDDARRSLSGGKIVANARKSGSTQDALLTPSVSELTYALLTQLNARLWTVTDEEAAAAQHHAANNLKLVVEPGGAAALAAALAGRLPGGDGALVLVASGGNV